MIGLIIFAINGIFKNALGTIIIAGLAGMSSFFDAMSFMGITIKGFEFLKISDWIQLGNFVGTKGSSNMIMSHVVIGLIIAIVILSLITYMLTRKRIISVSE